MSRTRGEPIHIVIADAQLVTRDGVRQLLESQPDMEVAGEAGDMAEALRQVRGCDPDILLLDLAAPGDGLGLIAQLRNERPWTRVLVVTALDTPDHVLAVLATGAKGYVLKTALARDLLEAIRVVSRGSTYVKVTPEMCPATLARGGA